MTTKTFKVGISTTAKIKISACRDGVLTWWFDWGNKVIDTIGYSHDDLNHLELDLCQARLNLSDVDTIMSWVLATKEYKNSFKEV